MASYDLAHVHLINMDSADARSFQITRLLEEKLSRPRHRIGHHQSGERAPPGAKGLACGGGQSLVKLLRSGDVRALATTAASWVGGALAPLLLYGTSYRVLLTSKPPLLLLFLPSRWQKFGIVDRQLHSGNGHDVLSLMSV
jgi:hypothetical protein